MIWIATLKDGSVIKQYERGAEAKITNLFGNENLNKFRITETSGDTTVQFSSDSGLMKFSNLDYMKLQELEGGEKLTLVFDKNTESFKLNGDSLDLFNKIALHDEKTYFYIEFDQSGIFNISGQLLYMGIVLPDGTNIAFANQPPYNKFDYIIDANDDFYMNGKTPVKKHNYVVRHTLSLEKTYELDDGVEFNVRHCVVLDILKGSVMLDSFVKCNKAFRANLYTIYSGKREANPIDFSPGSPIPVRKVLNLL